MKSAFDDRIVQVNISFPDGVRTYECIGSNGFSIYASGQKLEASPMNQCEIKIFNLTPDERNFIISQTSPLRIPRLSIPITLNVGRASYGTFTLYTGFISYANTTQPPDIGITITAQTNFLLTGLITSNTQPAVAPLSLIAQNIAQQNNLTLNFLATDKQISNFNYNGSTAYQVNQLNVMGGVIAYVDNQILVVKNKGSATNNGAALINANNGMVGIPTFTEKGITVTMMISNIVNLGNLVTVQSIELPAANGDYYVQKILFDLASRDNQFYYTLDCISTAINVAGGTLG